MQILAAITEICINSKNKAPDGAFLYVEFTVCVPHSLAVLALLTIIPRTDTMSGCTSSY